MNAQNLHTTPAAQSNTFHTLHNVPCLYPSEQGDNYKNMNVYEWGDSANPRVLVCVHGLTRNGRDFDLVAQRMANLAKTHRVLCVDVVGRGLSEWAESPEHYNIGQYVGDIASLREFFNLETFEWLGTSMGGLIGMAFQSRHPGVISKLILNDIGPVIGQDAISLIAQYVGKNPVFPSRAAAVEYARKIMGGFGAQTEAEWGSLTNHYYVAVLDDAGRDTGAVKFHYDPQLGEASRTTMNLPDAVREAGEKYLWTCFESFKCPVLIIRGINSELLQAHIATQMLQRNSQAQLVTIPNTAHAPHLYNDAQTDIIETFLNGK